MKRDTIAIIIAAVAILGFLWTLHQDVSAVQTNIASMQTNIASMQGDVASIQGDVAELRERMAKLEGLFEGYTRLESARKEND